MTEGKRPLLVVAANSGWNIANFRGGLIRGLQAAGYDVHAIAPDAVLLPGVEWSVTPLDRSGLNPVADFRLMRSYRAILQRLRPVCLLGFTIKPNVYGAFAAAGLGIPVIANISGLGTAFMKRGLLSMFVTRLYRRALRRAHVVFFQNPDDRALFVERRIVRSEQARLLPGSGIDLDRFAPWPEEEHGPLRFLLVARLLGDKGVREFAEAVRLLRPEFPDARFQLLGPLDEGNRTAIRREELDDWITDGLVEYLGEARDVRPHLAAASAVVLPSYREGLPRSLLEAGAMGRPLIATDVPGCRELVEDGVTGLSCAARSSLSLADAMRRFAELAPSERCLLGEAARDRVQARFSEQRVIDAYLCAIAELRPS